MRLLAAVGVLAVALVTLAARALGLWDDWQMSLDGIDWEDETE